MGRPFVSVIAILPLLFWAGPGLAQAYGDRDPWWHPGWGWGHMIFGSLMMFLFWGGIIVLIALLVRWIGGGQASSPPPSPPSRQTALEVLQVRFAKGEIDKEEYEERKKLLSE